MAAIDAGSVSRDIHGKRTNVLLQTFADRFLVIVTQVGKVGSLIQASIPPTAPLLTSTSDPEQPDGLSLPEPSPAIQLTPLLGSASSEHFQVLQSLYVSQIATILWTEEAKAGSDARKSVIVGVALAKREGLDPKERERCERDEFEGVMAMVLELLKSK